MTLPPQPSLPFLLPSGTGGYRGNGDFEENDGVVGGISGNDDDGGSDRVIYEFDPFARVPAATLDAPSW